MTTDPRALGALVEAVHAVVYFAPEPQERYAALGLRGSWRGYFASRTAALGPVGAEVATAVLGGFAPDMVARALPGVWATAAPQDVVDARRTGAGAALRRLLPAPPPPLLAEAARAVDLPGRPLAAAHRALPRPTDPYEALWHDATVLREHRGDGHVAVVVAAGLTAVEANVLTELWTGMELGSYTATRGWSPDQQAAAVASLEARGWVAGGRLTDAGTSARTDLEERTDAAAQAVVDALGADLDAVVEQLDGWGARVIEASGFPADALKRAAG